MSIETSNSLAKLHLLHRMSSKLNQQVLRGLLAFRAVECQGEVRGVADFYKRGVQQVRFEHLWSANKGDITDKTRLLGIFSFDCSKGDLAVRK